MSWLDALLGRSRPVKSKLERLFALTTAGITLEVKAELKPAGRAGICFRPVTSSDFDATRREVEDLLAISAKDTTTKVEQTRDKFGYLWIVLEDEDLEDLVATAHMISLTLEEHGFGERLLAAVFKFVSKKGPAYWIYNYKRGAFYPFVPRTGDERDNAEELRIQAIMAKEMPLEPDLSKWYALWGIPV